MGEKIYHAPWSKHYAATRIDTAKGERRFCSEAEAKAAGWRAPYRRKDLPGAPVPQRLFLTRGIICHCGGHDTG
jgi:hypothetical protein